MKSIPFTLGLVVLLCSVTMLSGQNCFNADFESGDASGYRTFTGSIDRDGNVVIENERLSADQHLITRVGDAFDPIAAAYCIENNELPTVPPVGGRYAMRLGNEDTGGEAERVVLTFTVDQATSFFLLRYAVVLEDPGHDPFEQPRFELSILDSDGNPYPCGAYAVRAGRDIPGFENCGEWRVRPWTSVGIELQSFLNEEIQIEIKTTDCSRGGHAGYAYFDATCSPLKIELFNYCSDSSTAIMQVTPGFIDYQWSTGDSTSNIQIENPTVGEIFYVTVTSATGCDLVLSDTIPRIEVIEAPTFGPPTETQLCTDTTFWFRPAGTNLNRIYSPDMGLFLDSFLIQNEFRQEYTFISYSDFGCGFDTVVHVFHELPKANVEIEPASCHNSLDGRVNLTSAIEGREVSFKWEDGSTAASRNDLAPDTYRISITDEFGCEKVDEIVVDAPIQINTQVNYIKDEICEGESSGSAMLRIFGGNRPYTFSYDGGISFVNNSTFSEYGLGSNLAIVKDANGCLDSAYIEIAQRPSPPVPNYEISLDSCGQVGARIDIDPIIGPYGPYSYSFDGQTYSQRLFKEGIGPGDYNISVKDNNGCISDTTAQVSSIESFRIDALNILQPPCDETLGAVEIIAATSFGVEFAINDLPFQENNTFENLPAGSYIAFIKNEADCMDSLNFQIEQPFQIVDILSNYNACEGADDSTQIFAEFGMPPFAYSLDGINFQESNLFVNQDVGSYVAYVRDQRDCIMEADFEILNYEPLNVGTLELEEPNCGLENGSILIDLSGGYGQTKITYNAQEYYNDGQFLDVGRGNYSFLIEDESNCFEELTVTLNSDCSLFIPNIFSPNGDGINDEFKIFTNDQSISIVNTYSIYDRWGNKVFENTDFDINDTGEFWDGTSRGKKMQSGVFVYHITLTYQNGQKEEKSGSVTLVR